MEMREMFPDAWHTEDPSSFCCRLSCPKCGGLITDILLWMEGYASLVAVLSTKLPSKTAQFMAYLCTIVHASRNFKGAAWTSYDAAYRCQAAATGSLDWAIVNSALYSEAFTGRARTLPRCRYCISNTHFSHECLYAPAKTSPPIPKVPRGAANSGGFCHPQPPGLLADAVELCGLFNRPGGNQCHYRYCRYAHICSVSHRPSPRS